MLFLLSYFLSYSIDNPRIYEAYASIDYYSQRMGIQMGKNDLWIAAVANVTGFRLLTTDTDFDHLDPVFLNHIRITYNQAEEAR